MGIFESIGNFFGGTPEIRENVSTLRPEQEKLYQQLIQSTRNRGAGGAFGSAADYYRNLLSDENADMDAFSRPEMRRFNEDIIPGLSEQFAGMGAGGLSSSGFRNAAVSAGTDLSERLGALRAQLRQSAAGGLANIGQQGLQPYSQNMVTQQGSPGLFEQFAPAIGTGLGFALGGPVGAAIGSAGGSLFGNRGPSASTQPGMSQNPNMVGRNSGPYGNNGFNSQLPNFNPSMRSY